MAINPLVIFLVAGGLALALLLVGVGITVSSARRTAVEERLERYTGVFTEDVEIEEAARARALTEWVSRRVEKTSFGVNLARELTRADLRLKSGEYIGISVIFMAVIGILAWYVGGKTILYAIAGAVFGLMLPRIYVKRQQKKRLYKFNDQLADMLSLMVNGLRAGFSTMQAMEAVSRELPAPISDEFRRVVQEMQLGINMEKSLNNLLQRIPSDDLDMVITAINVQREVGGNLAEVLDTISFTIRERVRIKGEIRALTAQATYSGRFLSIMPIIIVFVLYGINRSYVMEFINPVNGICGFIALGVAALLIILGYFAMTKIADIEI